MLVHDSVQTVPSKRLRDRDLEASAGHLLRLCLDLQLDALLLTLGALAADRAQDAAPTNGSTHAAPAVAGTIPWHRWITEDVDLACRLAAEALAGNAALPPSLGSDLGHAMPATIIDDLVARYTSMLALLQDLSKHNTSSQPAGLDEAIARTDSRLAELSEHRLLATPPTGIDLRAAHEFLPGELLG